jgi:GT2 family glycosyltransferase/glycosyltransferase involved in cell wall biosynthesis
VILVDNASTDETPLLTEQVRGLRLVRNDSNLGFTVAANIGARAAAGEFLLFLNNDAELRPGSIDHLVSTARQSPSIGAVGGKLVYPDGRLQEAGSIIWPDGSCEAYGRGADPVAPEFLFERPVDFCSGALLLTPRATFERLGGFEERFRPAYYEDADYCARLWENGYSVMYQPRAVAIHHEFGSAPSAAASMRLQRERRVLFVERHGEWLQKQRPRADGVLVARSHPHGRPAVLIIDDAVPDPRRGAGFPRAAALLNVILDLGYQVTLYTTGDERRPACGAFPTVEVVPGTPAGLRAFLHKRIGSSRSTQLLLVSRPHNMRFVKAVAGADLSALAIPCVYDAEAIFALREIGRRHIAGTGAASPFVNALPGRDDDSFVEQELKLARGCRAVLTVSERERQCFSQAGVANVFVVGHAADPDPTPTPFHLRQRVLSVGSFTAGSPNEDAALFFCREVLPLIGESLPLAQVVFAGAGIPDHLRTAWPDVTWQSDVDDLSPFYDDARVFVAPTRYAAGIPLKVVEAASRGVPVVCTPLLAEQLGWTPGADVLTAQTAAEFASAIHLLLGDALLWSRLRENALDRAKREYSREVFHSAVRRALAAAIPNANAGRVFTLEPVRISDPDTRGSGPSDVARPHDEEEAGDWSTPSRDRAAR